MMTKLSDLGIIITGNTPKTSDEKNYASNDIPFVKPSDLSDEEVILLEKSEFYISEYARDTARILPANSVLVSCIGIIGKVAINQVECSFNQQINAIIPNPQKCLSSFLAYSIQYHKYELQEVANAAVVPIINKSQFSNMEIELPSLEKQSEIVEKLTCVDALIKKRQQQLSKLDELVKSRFIEMFGDPTWNPMELPVVSMTELCSIIDGDRGKNYPRQEEFFDKGHCLFLNAKNVTANGFCFDNCMFITEEKDNILRNGKLTRGDVVLTTRGTVGNLAFYDDTIPFDHVRINSGMVILRLKKDSICETFFIEQFKMQLQTIKEKVLSGSAQPQLPISTMNQIKLLVPPLEHQNQFAAFVEQTDKLKFEIKQSLEKLETLKKALMQKYFG